MTGTINELIELSAARAIIQTQRVSLEYWRGQVAERDAKTERLLKALGKAADALGEAQGEYYPVSVAYCPNDIAALKEWEAEAREVLEQEQS